MQDSKRGFRMRFVALTEHIYTILMLYAVFAGAVVCLLFLVSFVAGSASLASLAVCVTARCSTSRRRPHAPEGRRSP